MTAFKNWRERHLTRRMLTATKIWNLGFGQRSNQFPDTSTVQHKLARLLCNLECLGWPCKSRAQHSSCSLMHCVQYTDWSTVPDPNCLFLGRSVPGYTNVLSAKAVQPYISHAYPHLNCTTHDCIFDLVSQHSVPAVLPQFQCSNSNWAASCQKQKVPDIRGSQRESIHQTSHVLI